MKTRTAAVSAALLSALCAQAADYYVAVTGHDANPGTSANQPWRTVQYAASNATAGSTVHIGSGTYTGPVTVAVSGTLGQPIVFRGEAGSSNVIITGRGRTPPNDVQGLFHVAGRSYIRLEDVTLCCYTGVTASHFHMGVYIGGTAHDVEIRNCRIHDIVHTKDEEGANGIGVYGTDEDTAISNIVIRGCEVYNCKLQYSESVTINGNVDGFLVESNHVHHNDNIGIDAIGWETDVAGGHRRARNGAIRDNRVHHISTTYNPTYNDYSAGGIYVDGGADIVIERNEVYLCDIGIEVGCEHAGKTAEDVIVRNNLVYRNHLCGIAFGGYTTALGSTRNCQFLNNTLYGNDTLAWWNGQFYIQKAQNNLIANNIIYALNDSDNHLFDERMSPPNASNNIFAFNVFYGQSGSDSIVFRREGTYRYDWADYAALTGDTNSLWGDPAFTDAVQSNFMLLTNSAAIDAGDPDFTPAAGETDFAGE